MKKPSVINIKKFFVSLGLFNPVVMLKNGEIPHDDLFFVNISDISYNSVDAVLLCDIESAVESIKKSTSLVPQRIKGFDSTIWRFTFPGLGYVSIEETAKNKYLTLDNGI